MTDTVPWSRQRWVWTVVIVLIMQVAVIYSLSDYGPLVRKQPPPVARLVLVNQPQADHQLAFSLATQDPTLFALAGQSNFSGTAWINPKPITNKLYQWKDPAFWIEPRIDAMSQLPSRLLAQAVLPESVSQLKPHPRLQDLFVTNELPLVESRLQVDGPLTNRLLSLAQELPSYPLDRPLRRTRVQVAVDPRGRVVSARLCESSGLASADSNALRYAKSLRFKRLPSPPDNAPATFPLEWSFLIFEWATIDAASTTPTPATPST